MTEECCNDCEYYGSYCDGESLYCESLNEESDKD